MIISLSRPLNKSMVGEVMDEGKRRHIAWICFVSGDNTVTCKFISDSLLSSSDEFFGALKSYNT